MTETRNQWNRYNNTCEYCGDEFNTHRIHAKTCSSKCRTALARLPKSYEKKLEQVQELLDWIKDNGRAAVGREQWELDLLKIAKRADGITRYG